MNQRDPCKISEYKDRYRFWSDKRISQLSFHNNLLLTLGVAAIGYFWKERDSVYRVLVIDVASPLDWKVFLFVVGMTILFLSILSGFVLSLSRLYDLRLTANVALTRKRCEQDGIKLEDAPLSESRFFSSLGSLWFVFWNYQNYRITRAIVGGKANNLLSRFTSVRQKKEDLGVLTWSLVKWQTGCMMVSMVFLITVLIIK